MFSNIKINILFILLLTFITNINAKYFDFKESFLNADNVYYNKQENFIEAKGNVTILNDNVLLKTDNIIIDLEKNIIISDSPISIVSGNEKILAESMIIDKSKQTGVFINSELLLNDTDLVIAQNMNKVSKEKFNIKNAKFTPCKTCHFGKPIWEINSEIVEVDLKSQNIVYKNASIRFFGLKIFITPYFSHPLKNANAKSGILMPKIFNNTLKIPLYYRAEDNLDFTYSPKFSSSNIIHELEIRHLTDKGKYEIFTSYNNSSLNGKEKVDRYYVNLMGDFRILNSTLGFNLGKVSDKSYLKNYYLDNRDFVESEIYINQFLDNGFNHGNIKHFQGLRGLDSLKTDPSIMPNILLKREYSFSEGWVFNVSNNFVNYREYSNKNIIRDRLHLGITKSHYGKFGEILSYGISNKFDFYNVDKNNIQDRKTYTRNIPEFHSSVRVPRSLNFKHNVIVFEPRISFTTGIRNPNKLSKIKLIDSPNIDVNENNIFKSSRYSGIDFHEYGKRFNYGLNVNVLNNNFTLSSFLGQAISSNRGEINSLSNYIGKISLKYKSTVELYYRFRKDKKNFKPKRDEIGFWLSNDKFTIHNNTNIIRDINNFGQFYYQTSKSNSNIIKQNYTNASLRLSKNVEIFGTLKVDLKDKLKNRILNYSTGLKFTYDCVSTYINFVNDYTSDPTRNVKKTKSYSFNFGLKTINF